MSRTIHPLFTSQSMKRVIASVLIVVALFAGAGIVYFGSTFSRSSGLETCTVTQFAVWSVESIHNSTTVLGTSTSTYIATTFTTSGYPSSTTNAYTGFMTGAISSWNGTTCS